MIINAPPFQYRCARCHQATISSIADRPAPAGCAGADHDWQISENPWHVAFHEAGHAVCAAALLGPDTLELIRIDPNAAAGVARAIIPTTHRAALIVPLAGPAAGRIIGDTPNMAADLRRFRRDALRMWRAEFGAEPLNQATRAALRRWLGLVRRDAFLAASEITRSHLSEILVLAQILVEQRYLGQPDLCHTLAPLAGFEPGPHCQAILEPRYVARTWMAATGRGGDKAVLVG